MANLIDVFHQSFSVIRMQVILLLKNARLLIKHLNQIFQTVFLIQLGFIPDCLSLFLYSCKVND